VAKINLDNYEAFLLDYSDGNLSEAEHAELLVFLLAHPDLKIDLNELDLPTLNVDYTSFEHSSDLKKNNTDLWDEKLFDAVEGNLSETDLAHLEQAMAADTSLRHAHELLKKTKLVSDNQLKFETKAQLFKTEDDVLLLDKSIAYLENTLPIAEKKAFEKELFQNKALKKDLELTSKTILKADFSVVFPDKELLRKTAKVIGLFRLRNVAAMAAAITLIAGFTLVFKFYSSSEKIEIAQTKPLAPNDNANAPLAVAKENAVTNNKAETDALAHKEFKKSSSKTVANTSDVFETVAKKEKTEAVEIESEINSAKINNEKLVASNDLSPAEISTDNTSEPIVFSTHYKSIDEISEEEDFADALLENQQKGVWKKAVALAKRAHMMGFKTIDGQENSGQRYRISINSFSVEKK